MSLITSLLSDAIAAHSLAAALGLSSAIVVLFLCLYTVSDRHLTVALRHIARCLRMPPDLAGMTLLAFGNGAPDFFTAVFGATQAPEMILSGAVGAALFTFTIVFGLVILLQTRPPPEPSVEDGNQPSASSQPSLTRVEPFPFFRNVLLCMFCSSCLFALLRIGLIVYWMPLILLLIYLANLSVSIVMHILRNGRVAPTSNSETAADTKIVPGLFWDLRPREKVAYILEHSLQWKDLPKNKLLRIANVMARLVRLPMAIILHLSILPVQFPEGEGPAEDDRGIALLISNRLRLLIVPWTSLALFGLVWNDGAHAWWVWAILAATALLATILLWLSSSWTARPRAFVLHAIYAFITCLGFIYLISRELISCLRALGEVIGVSSSTMGVLVLAWGNSFGDLVADTTMSRTGHLNMAIFGVFAAHIQNVLFTLGTAFLIATLDNPSRSVHINYIDPTVYFGLAIVAVVLVSSLVLVPTLGRFTLPRWCGFVLLSFYATFACVALLLEFRVFGI